MALLTLYRNIHAFTRCRGAVLCSLRQYSSQQQVKLIDVQHNQATNIVSVSMNKKPANTLDTALLLELRDAIDDLNEQKCRGMILTSTLPTIFSAGIEISEMYGSPKDKLSIFWSTLQSSWLELYRSSFPTVAVINGASPAGGCLLAMSCEYRIMVDDNKSRIGLNETQLGIIAPEWFYMVMKNTIGQRQTEKALTQGYMFSPKEALEVGLIDEIVPDKEAGLLSAEKFIAKFDNIPGVARKVTKELCRSEAIKFMEEKPVEDIKVFVDFITQPAVQKGLELYIQNLKKK